MRAICTTSHAPCWVPACRLRQKRLPDPECRTRVRDCPQGEGASVAGKRNCDDALILALAAGASTTAAAEQARVSDRLVRRRLEEPPFRAKVDAARAELVSRAVGRLSAVGVLAGQT